MSETTTKFQCIGECKRAFGVGDWECAPGIRHEVEPKTFYMLDAPYQNPDSKYFDHKAYGRSRTVVENCPPERKEKDSLGNMTVVPGGNVTFVRGTVEVKDPEKIYWLERTGFGQVTREQWLKVYFSPTEKQQLKELELKNRERELERKTTEVNDLLALAKSQAAVKVDPKKKEAVSA